MHPYGKKERWFRPKFSTKKAIGVMTISNTETAVIVELGELY